MLVIVFIVVLIVIPIGSIYFGISTIKIFNTILKQNEYQIYHGVLQGESKMVFIGNGSRPKVDVRLDDGTVIQVILLSDLKETDTHEIMIHSNKDQNQIFYYNTINEYVLLVFGIVAIIAGILFAFFLFRPVIKRIMTG